MSHPLFSIGPVHIRVKGCWEEFSVSIQISIEYYARERWSTCQTLRTIASEPDLHCLTMPHKKDGMLINVVWVNPFL